MYFNYHIWSDGKPRRSTDPAPPYTDHWVFLVYDTDGEIIDRDEGSMIKMISLAHDMRAKGYTMIDLQQLNAIKEAAWRSKSP